MVTINCQSVQSLGFQKVFRFDVISLIGIRFAQSAQPFLKIFFKLIKWKIAIITVLIFIAAFGVVLTVD